MKKLLVPIDFSDLSEKILNNAEKLASSFNASLLLIHVAPPVTESIKNKIEYQTLPSLGELGSGYSAAIRYDVVREQIAHELKEEHSKLLAIKEDLIKRGIKAKALLIQGEIVDAIINEAEQINADMIIMGSHGHGPWHKAILGSTTDGVIRETNIPILVVPINKKD